MVTVYGSMGAKGSLLTSDACFSTRFVVQVRIPWHPLPSSFTVTRAVFDADLLLT